METKNILLPREVDELFRYPRGRAMKLAKAGKLPFITLPDGEIRFDENDLYPLLNSNRVEQGLEVAHVG